MLLREEDEYVDAENAEFERQEPEMSIESVVEYSLGAEVDSSRSAANAFAVRPTDVPSTPTPTPTTLAPAPAPTPIATSVPKCAAYSELSDQELLDGVRLQSESHFAELYSRYFQRIYNFVYARMRNHAETEEVVQETFLAVFRSFDNYRGQSSLLSWIYGIAKNSTNNSLRRMKSQNERIDLADDEDLIPRASMGVGTPEEQLDLARFKGLLSSRLAGLADWQVEIFHLRHFENLSIPEISARTSRSSDAVRSSLYRVKRIFFDTASSTAMPAVPARGASR